MTELTPLSPAAQAVLDTVKEICPAPADEIAAAALRAAACQLREAYVNEVYFEPADDWLDSIATELENTQ